MDTKNGINDAAEAIWSEDLTPLALKQVTRIVDQGDGSLLLSEVLRLAQVACKTKEDAVSEVMSKLDKLAEATDASAHILMMHLWPIAGDCFMHDIADAIDLRIWACKSLKLTEQLRNMADSEPDLDTRRHYESAANRGSAGGPT